MQPLDISLIFPLTIYYDAALKQWPNDQTDHVVTILQIGSIFGKAYLRTANPVTITKDFCKCSTIPFDRDIFSEVGFLPAEVTYQCEQTEKFPQKGIHAAETADNSPTLWLTLTSQLTHLLLCYSASANIKPLTACTTLNHITNIPSTSSSVSLSEIQPLPKMAKT
jgi:hypothetical protein